MSAQSPALLYPGSVKNLLGPVEFAGTAQPGIVFEYTDAYSVFDWGRMPDGLARKGEALAILAADLFERLEAPEAWREFSRSETALALRRAHRFGPTFIELGEKLQQEGLRTHYLGALESAASTAPVRVASLTGPVKYFAVRAVSAVRPQSVQVLGREVSDYTETRVSPAPRLVPLEVVFRFGVPEGSSLVERVARDPGYLASIGYGDLHATAGARWDFPVMELFTKLESSDRVLTLSEALAISGLTGEQLQGLLLKTAWVAGFLRGRCAAAGIELADGKLEWGLDEHGETFLVDAVGPDELRLLKSGVQLSKEFLRLHYRGSPWYKALEKAKSAAKTQGISDWKKLVTEPPAKLPETHREAASQLYPALTNALTGKRWFPEAWSLDQVVEGLRKL
jgi:phosphoribosylaminoimidazole-succinocarboxamide synthase